MQKIQLEGYWIFWEDMGVAVKLLRHIKKRYYLYQCYELNNRKSGTPEIFDITEMLPKDDELTDFICPIYPNFRALKKDIKQKDKKKERAS
jgi:hypothetical protein